MNNEPPTPASQDRPPAEATPAKPVPGRRSRLRRRILIGMTGVLVLALTATTGLLWMAAGRFVQPIDDTPLNTHVIATSPGTVTLPATTDSQYNGTYGLVWQEERSGRRHQGTLGRILTTGDGTVTRQLTADTPPAPGAKAKVIVTVWASDPEQAHGLDYQEVTYPGELGAMPAWFLPGAKDTWIIQVHGLGAGRAAGLRTIPHLNSLGHPILDITYRNDPGAPHDTDGTRKFGDTEWRDLDAAVRYARARGAADAVLFGFSMGGGIVETYLQRATDTSAVSAVILDSPALDYRAAFNELITGFGVPSFVAGVGSRFIELRADMDLDDVNSLAANRRSGGPRQPVLLFHGTGDTVVPYSTSADFARAWPEKTTLVTVDRAGHTGSWNTDPHRYHSELTAFLEQHTPS